MAFQVKKRMKVEIHVNLHTLRSVKNFTNMGLTRIEVAQERNLAAKISILSCAPVLLKLNVKKIVRKGFI